MEELPGEDEINEVVWACDPSRAPGSDGYNLNFVRKMWHVIGLEFQEMVRGFFQFGTLKKSLNMTWVTLIPKFERGDK